MHGDSFPAIKLIESCSPCWPLLKIMYGCVRGDFLTGTPVARSPAKVAVVWAVCLPAILVAPKGRKIIALALCPWLMTLPVCCHTVRLMHLHIMSVQVCSSHALLLCTFVQLVSPVQRRHGTQTSVLRVVASCV